MSIINEQILAAKWLEEYANQPLINPTYEEAIARLIKLGIILPNGEVEQEYSDFIIKNN